MREARAKHIKQDESIEAVTIIEVVLKANDDLYVIYIDSEGTIDGDEVAKFTGVSSFSME